MTHTVESFQIEGWKDPFAGLVLAENENWVLLQNNPVDFVLDGYRLVRKEVLASRFQGGSEELTARVLGLRGTGTDLPDGFSFGDAEEMLRWIEKEYDLFQFQDDDEDAAYIGRIDNIDDGYMQLMFVDPNGVEDPDSDLDYAMNNIYIIEFATDYVDGICRLWKDNK